MRFFLLIALIVAASPAFAQLGGDPSTLPEAPAVSADAQGPQGTSVSAQPGLADTPTAPGLAASQPGVPASKQQPKRILGFMPNYRAVSAGAIPPPPTPREAFKLAGQNSFDYSSFLFVGLTSLLAKGTDAHPQLGKGPEGLWAYTWRGFIDKTDGNYLVLFALPTVFHEDERYFSKGEGGFWKRSIYAGSRVLITPNYHGHNTFNTSEILGRGIAQGVSLAYYPSQDQNISDLSEKFGYAVGRDALTNVFREFWPDIATHILHRHP